MFDLILMATRRNSLMMMLIFLNLYKCVQSYPYILVWFALFDIMFRGGASVLLVLVIVRFCTIYSVQIDAN